VSSQRTRLRVWPSFTHALHPLPALYSPTPSPTLSLRPFHQVRIDLLWDVSWMRVKWMRAHVEESAFSVFHIRRASSKISSVLLVRSSYPASSARHPRLGWFIYARKRCEKEGEEMAAGAVPVCLPSFVPPFRALEPRGEVVLYVRVSSPPSFTSLPAATSLPETDIERAIGCGQERREKFSLCRRTSSSRLLGMLSARCARRQEGRGKGRM
jgi:hypothetical protein